MGLAAAEALMLTSLAALVDPVVTLVEVQVTLKVVPLVIMVALTLPQQQQMLLHQQVYMMGLALLMVQPLQT